jgi:hypothetical protein
MRYTQLLPLVCALWSLSIGFGIASAEIHTQDVEYRQNGTFRGPFTTTGVKRNIRGSGSPRWTGWPLRRALQEPQGLVIWSRQTFTEKASDRLQDAARVAAEGGQ